MNFGMTLLETAGHTELPIPAWGYGIIAFCILTSFLLITLAIGKGRLHS